MDEKITLIKGDCLKELKKLSDNSVDLIITDPPYKVSQNYGSGVDADNLRNVASILRTLPEMCRILKEGRFLVCFYDNRILPFLFEAIKDTELVYRKSIYLYRRWGNAHRWMGWMQTTDPVCFFVKGHNKPFYESKIKAKVKHDCYIKSKPEKETTGHPAQKPLEIIEDIITWCSTEGDTILDRIKASCSNFYVRTCTAQEALDYCNAWYDSGLDPDYFTLDVDSFTLIDGRPILPI